MVPLIISVLKVCKQMVILACSASLPTGGIKNTSMVLPSLSLSSCCIEHVHFDDVRGSINADLGIDDAVGISPLLRVEIIRDSKVCCWGSDVALVF